jgi:hypothetical protein
MAAQSLGEFLGTIDPRPEDMRQAEGFDSYADLPPTEFCKRILASREFRQYIMNGIVLGDIAPGILTRIMDAAGWPKSPDKVEVKDTTVRVEDLTPEQLEERAARLAEMAEFLRRAEQFDEPLSADSVH